MNLTNVWTSIPIAHVHLSSMSAMSTSEEQDSVFYASFGCKCAEIEFYDLKDVGI